MRGTLIAFTGAVVVESLREFFKPDNILAGIGEIALVQVMVEESLEMVGMAWMLSALFHELEARWREHCEKPAETARRQAA